tara:strand:- start:2522 stop:3115 length:594 start_codon:yes stop_codon:yes gene_type:complete
LDLGHSIRRDKVEVYAGGGSITYRWSDVRSVTPSDIGILGDDDWKPSIVFAAPPCTNLAVSGARDFSKKGMQGLIDGLILVEACRRLCDWFGVPWMLENPVSRLSSCWRKPDYIFQPWEFGDNYTKKTCLWTGGGFVMPSPRVLDEPPDVENSIHEMSPGPDRADRRSITPQGFALAVMEANSLQPSGVPDPMLISG